MGIGMYFLWLVSVRALEDFIWNFENPHLWCDFHVPFRASWSLAFDPGDCGIHF